MPERPKQKSSHSLRTRLFGRVFLALIAFAIISALIFVVRSDYIQSLSVLNTAKETTDSKNIVAIFCAKSCVAVDEDGKAVDYAPRPNGTLILYVDNEFVDPPQIGEKIVSEEILKELAFLREEIKNQTGVQLIKASQSRLVAEDFDILTDQNWRLRLSTSNNAYATVRILTETLDQVRQKNQTLEYVDLRIENRVYLKTL